MSRRPLEHGPVVDLNGGPTVATCACCGWEDTPVEASVCLQCGGNPAAEEVPCEECKGEGEITYEPRGPHSGYLATCPACQGARVVEAPYFYARLEGLEEVRRAA